jgi:hypothetical protein
MFAKVGLFEHIYPLFGYRLTISFYNKGEFEYKNSATHINHQQTLITKMLFIFNKKNIFVENKQHNEFEKTNSFSQTPADSRANG